MMLEHQSGRSIEMSYQDVFGAATLSTASHSRLPLGSPLVSTQQLRVDWSDFTNHTFFNSAVVKVNDAFDRIINQFPFDGSSSEVQEFLDSLTGFERWVFDSFPTYRGALHFSGTQEGETTGGTHISVKDASGVEFPSISTDDTGASTLDPVSSSFAVELSLLVPAASNDTQIICQKLDRGNSIGFTLFISESSSTTEASVGFSVESGSSKLSTRAALAKGAYKHLCALLDRTQPAPRAVLFVDAVRSAESSDVNELGPISTGGVDLSIGSGSSFYDGLVFTVPQTTLSGVVDELRFFHTTRTAAQQKFYADRPLRSTDDLALYFKFNEPPPLLSTTASDPVNSVVLDSSGKSHHSYVENFTGSQRIDVDALSNGPMALERASSCPVLFPAHSGVIALNTRLLLSATSYDIDNPNLITRLIPPHYFADGRTHDGVSEDEAAEQYGGTSIPGSGRLGSPQLLSTLLFTWAKFFDEIKLHVGAFSSLEHADSSVKDDAPDTFLHALARRRGLDVPVFFGDSTVDQFTTGDDLDLELSAGTSTLRSVQAELMRRLLMHSGDIIRSKGTRHSIEAFFRTIGVEPGSSVRIREYGGPTVRRLSSSRDDRKSTSRSVQFGTSSWLESPVLSGSRIEVGFPEPAGTLVRPDLFPPHGISDDENDGMFTSGSWSLELELKYPSVTHASTQSIARIVQHVTGAEGRTVLASLVTMSGSDEQAVELRVRPVAALSAPTLSLSLSASVFDGADWRIAFGCRRNDEIDSVVSSSYFLTAASSNDGKITSYYATSSYFDERTDLGQNALRERIASASAPFISVGSSSYSTGTGMLHLNDTAVGGNADASFFDGVLHNLRFWSRALIQTEIKEHTRNPKSFGAADPAVGFNFVTSRTGSFGRLRLDAPSGKFFLTGTNLTCYDTSLNTLHLTGSSFDESALVTRRISHSEISPRFDEASTSDKVRIRGLVVPDDEHPWAGAAPVHEVPRNEEPFDDQRMSIEVSLGDVLSSDIAGMFAGTEKLEDVIGSPELAFADEYPGLDVLRRIYFNRLKEKIDFKAFSEFFRWFDRTTAQLVEKLVPLNTKYKGFNFVIEPHMLERGKLGYFSVDQYLSNANKFFAGDNVSVPELQGELGKY